MLTLAAEFPNDNPDLHRGVIWMNLEVVGEASPIPPLPRESTGVAAKAAEATDAVEVSGAGEASGAVEVTQPAPASPRESGIRLLEDAKAAGPDDDVSTIVVEELEPVGDIAVEGEDSGFDRLVAVLSEIAAAEGAPDAAVLARALLLEQRAPPGVPAEVAAALEEGRVLAGAALTTEFVNAARAWRAILCGAEGDFSACAGAMLDEWAADLLARLLGTPARAPVLRRELRARGVAAFGLAA